MPPQMMFRGSPEWEATMRARGLDVSELYQAQPVRGFTPQMGQLPFGLGRVTPPIVGAGIAGGGGGGLLQPEAGTPVALAGILAALKNIAPAVLAGIAGMALGQLGQGDDGEPLDTPFQEGLRFPWETPGGEGFIAPWTEQVQLPSGLIGQLGAGYPGQGIAKSWSTGTAVFYMLTDGRITVQRKNGTWKTYRPQKHIVISRNPRISAIRKLDRAHKRVGRMVARYAPKKRAAVVTSPYLSAVERKALKGGGN